MADALNVFWHERLVGRLWRDESLSLLFQYDPTWLTAAEASPLSVRLPLQEEPFDPDRVRPFFSNLLPEAGVRSRIARSLGVSEGNDFKLLEELGGDCAGALSLIPEGASPGRQGGYRPLSQEELDSMIEEMPQRPLLISQEGVRLSLAGAQEKLPVYMKGDQVFLPQGSLASSHILKPAIPQFPDTVENEAFCMQLAARCGLPVPSVSIRPGRHRALLIERYDRSPSADGPLRRLHQEDMCQALGVDHARKYETEGGPGLKDCFAVLDRHSSQPILDKRELLGVVVFNFLIGNCDAHAKNFSLLYSGGALKLAPFYDLLSTRAYPQLSPKLAMKIGGQIRPEWVGKEHWQRLADDAGVAPKAVFQLCEQLSEKTPAEAQRLAERCIPENGAEDTLRRILRHIETMSRNALARLRKE